MKRPDPLAGPAVPFDPDGRAARARLVGSTWGLAEMNIDLPPEEVERIRKSWHARYLLLRNYRAPGGYDPEPRSTRDYACQVCGQKAEYPREKVRRIGFARWGKDVVWQAPLACLNCRMLRYQEVLRLGDGRRRFWKRAFALWDGDPQPSFGHRMEAAIHLRIFIPRAIRDIARSIRQLVRGRR